MKSALLFLGLLFALAPSLASADTPSVTFDKGSGVVTMTSGRLELKVDTMDVTIPAMGHTLVKINPAQ